MGRGHGRGRGRGRGGRFGSSYFNGGRGNGGYGSNNNNNGYGPAAGGVEGFEEPDTVGKVTLHSLDFWVIDSGATYSMTPRADLLTELEPPPVLLHWQRTPFFMALPST
ncbi:hypothetical protein CLOM_g10673 [Closterium sp. NIES-68]|nr:hypothetical protein CLOM_g10673 [Closterium sp. NIES-68]